MHTAVLAFSWCLVSVASAEETPSLTEQTVHMRGVANRVGKLGRGLTLKSLPAEDQARAKVVDSKDQLTPGMLDTLRLKNIYLLLGWDDPIEDWGNPVDPLDFEMNYIVFFPQEFTDTESEDYGYNSVIAFYNDNGVLMGYGITIYTGNSEESVSDIRVEFFTAQGYTL